MATLVDEVFRGRVTLSDLNELTDFRMMLAEVRAETTLAGMYRYHSNAPFRPRTYKSASDLQAQHAVGWSRW
jgi:hypothetical protein